VRLVYGKRPHIGALQEIAKAGDGKPLRRCEEQLDLAVEHITFDRALLVAALRAVELRRRDTAFAKPVDLIFHQRDQRRDDDGDVLAEQSRSLITE